MKEGIGESAQWFSQGIWTLWAAPTLQAPHPIPQSPPPQLPQGHCHTWYLDLGPVQGINHSTGQGVPQVTDIQRTEEENFPSSFRSWGPKWSAD